VSSLKNKKRNASHPRVRSYSVLEGHHASLTGYRSELATAKLQAITISRDTSHLVVNIFRVRDIHQYSSIIIGRYPSSSYCLLPIKSSALYSRLRREMVGNCQTPLPVCRIHQHPKEPMTRLDKCPDSSSLSSKWARSIVTSHIPALFPGQNSVHRARESVNDTLHCLGTDQIALCLHAA